MAVAFFTLTGAAGRDISVDANDIRWIQDLQPEKDLRKIFFKSAQEPIFVKDLKADIEESAEKASIRVEALVRAEVERLSIERLSLEEGMK